MSNNSNITLLQMRICIMYCLSVINQICLGVLTVLQKELSIGRGFVKMYGNQSTFYLVNKSPLLMIKNLTDFSSSLFGFVK